MPVTVRPHTFSVLPLLIALVLMASLFTLTSPAEAASRAHKVGKAFDIVRAQQGDRYRYGAAGPNRFDCSGLVYYSFGRAGFRKIPRTSDAQARHARRIKRKNLQRGDLVFFHKGRDVYHVGVYAGHRDGHRTIIHASRPGTPVKRDRIWTDSWFPGTLR